MVEHAGSPVKEQRDRCGDLLDRARAIDPAGESDPRVIQARAAVDRALAPEPPPPSPFEKQDKPHAPPPP